MDSRIQSNSLTGKRINGIPQSSTVRIADLATELRRQGQQVVDLSAGRASEATAVAICTAAKQALDDGHTHQTPAKGTASYREVVSEKLYRVNQLKYGADTGVMATSGCKNGLMLGLFAILDPGDEVIIEDPCFVSYGPTIELCGGKPVPVVLRKANDYRWSAEDLAAAITPKTKAILFCSPHNPLGIVHSKADLEIIANAAIGNDLVVFADEIYEAVAWSGRTHIPIASLPGMRERTIGLMGMTKSYSMGGWRIGYAYAADDIITAMEKGQQHMLTCSSSIAQIAASFALSAEMTEAMTDTWNDWENRCDFMARELNAVESLSCKKPEGGFYIWLDVSHTGLNGTDFADRLLMEHYVTVVPGETFGPSSGKYIRITAVKSWDNVREAVKRIQNFVMGL